uniref:Uncharacterized protein n=1 Tax=Rhizophora mucronata TaxID=61149 RepID=A0A2P2PZD5_RHIMU
MMTVLQPQINFSRNPNITQRNTEFNRT